jgi:membrane protease YdiL (CAAX protease family)
MDMNLPIKRSNSMLKIMTFHKKRKKLNSRIIASVLILTLMTIFPVAASADSSEYSHAAGTGTFLWYLSAEAQGNEGNSIPALTPYQWTEITHNVDQYTDVAHLLGGFGIAVLMYIIYNLPELPSLSKIRKLFEIDNTDLERSRAQRIRLYTTIPVLCIVFAELLLFLGKIEAAAWVHIGTLIALTLFYVFVKDPEIHKIYMALAFLPVLRLVNLSMPVFFEITLYRFIFIYVPIAIPVAIIVIDERNSFKEIGFTTKNILLYTIISLPIGFLLGFGEYVTIQPGYLIPDLTFGNLIKLTFIMVFFVGLVEELIFRLILQTRLEHALSIQEALVITSLLFGFMHSGYGTYFEILYKCFVGFIMGLAFYKTRSLPFVTFLHGFANVFLFGVLPLHVIG